MGHKVDQDYAGETHRPADHPNQGHDPTASSPSLAETFTSNEHLGAPPPYAETFPTYCSQPLSRSWSSQDPRSSSSQSLVPHASVERDGKRTLLLVYVHGFMGNETSFQSFPAHVHNVVTVTLAESHVVHTKIYPRYKSRKHIEFARDAFIEWLCPHEGPDIDVVLLGHSMGGIVAAEVVLLEKHRFLGTINFDTPFLGMHPGVIASGLGSLFRPAPDSPAPKATGSGADILQVSKTRTNDASLLSVSPSYFGPEASSASTPEPTRTNSTATLPIPSSLSSNLPVKDPNYDPPFVNDVRIPQRNFWTNALHFINKHSDGLTKATQAYVESHLEFGGAMADYTGLKKRYEKVRALEDGKTPEGHRARRVRFVNYYTASTGRPKKPKEQKAVPVLETPKGETGDERFTFRDGTKSEMPEVPIRHSLAVSHEHVTEKADNQLSPQDDITHADENALDAVGNHADDESSISDGSMVMEHVEPIALTDDERDGGPGDGNESKAFQARQSTSTSDPHLAPLYSSNLPPPSSHQVPNLPPVLPAPEEPPPFDPSPYEEKDTRKLAEKDHARLVKAYKQATKNRDKAIIDRRKLLEKREKNAAREREKQLKAEEKERVKLEQQEMEKEDKDRAKIEKAEAKRQEKEKAKAEREALKKAAEEGKAAITARDPVTADSETKEEKKPKRDKKFCMLPPKINGDIDPCWVRVFMPGVDEVGAHCGLFFEDGERYQGFVNDVAGRIKMWIVESGN